MKKPAHIFSVCAYQQSPYLEDCIRSLMAQEVKTDVIICTSTPNRQIREIAAKYMIPLYVRTGKPGIAQDFNFACEQAAERLSRLKPGQSQLVTIAHQDDIYHKDYTKALFYAYSRYPDLSLFTCRYDTIDAEGRRVFGSAEFVKRILRRPLRNHKKADRTKVKLKALSYGNAIGCPTCTYNMAYCDRPLFSEQYRFVLDWDALIRLAKSEGRFICVERSLLSYRVHDGAATSENIKNHNREREEEAMFQQLHGRFVASLLMRFYRRAYGAYQTT